MRECVDGMVFFSSSLVSYEIKHLFKFFSVHKDVCIQKRIPTNVTSKSKDKNNCTVDRVAPEIQKKRKTK